MEANSDGLSQEPSKSLSEIGEHEPIEVVAEQNIIKTTEQEAFANDILTIRVHPDNQEGSLPVVTPAVNGINQPIIRGVESKIKRKYVEALARCRTTKYTQSLMDSRKPENIQLEGNTMITYPFAVLHDPHPNGAVWLEAILAQP